MVPLRALRAARTPFILVSRLDTSQAADGVVDSADRQSHTVSIGFARGSAGIERPLDTRRFP